ncbi:MAG: LLM class F420-dependent oxidoreductase [Acidimicrobiia bacterium]
MAYGITVPFDGVPLAEHRSWYEELAALGYTDVWSGEASALDAFTPLTLAAAWAPQLRVGTAIAPVYTRGAATLAVTAAALAEAAPGRFALGVGSSSDVIVENWNAVPFVSPWKRVRDTVRFLRAALSGERVDTAYDTFSVSGFRLARPPQSVPPILVAALRPGMLRLAGSEGDGAILNWLSSADVPRVAPLVGAGKEIVARIFVAPTTDADAVRALGRRFVAAYLNVGVYAAFQEWLGRGDVLRPMWDAWSAGDRKGAVDAIPDALVDEFIGWGEPKACRDFVARYVDNGVTTPVVALLLPPGVDQAQAVRNLAPGA